MIGKTLAHFEVIEKIGAGGMGEVYRARDTKLGRVVAIKILPPDLARDTDRMNRFEQEARVLAALNHPGIAPIFSIEKDGDVRFLTMELVEGEDLSDRLARGPLPVTESVRVMAQVAEALEEAHARGIVHRDLKPANIKLPPKGPAKVLDFGLAKPGDQRTHEGDPTLPLTREGMIMGTAAYMSPEQARGRDVDARSDIWSFGCVLWECVTGRMLFRRDTSSDTLAAVLQTEPDWSGLPADLPPNLRRVLRRCLEKDPEKRLHHMADVRLELENREEVPLDPAMSRVERSLQRTRIAAFVFLGLLLATVIGFLGTRGGRNEGGSGAPDDNPLEGAKFTKLTNFPGDEFEADISPDGRFVAFVSDRDGPFDILVGQIGVGGFRNVTADSKTFLHEDVRAPVRSVGFTRDGSGVWLGGGTGRRLKSISLLGGEVVNLLGEKAVNVDWSPDGSRCAYHLWTAGDPVYVAEGDGGNGRLILPSEPGYHQHYPTWSRDGEWIYLVRGRAATGDMDLWRMRPDGSDLKQLTRNLKRVTFPAPIDDRTVLFCAEEPDGAGPWLWAYDVDTGTSRRVSFGVEEYTSVASSDDGRRIVVTVENPQAELWRVPILERVATENDARLLDLPSARAVAPRFGPDRLFYLSSRGSGDGLWSFRDGESVEIWSGSEAPLLETPAVSPDGNRVALVLEEGTRQRLHILTADGAERRALTDEVDVRGSVSWSPDARWIVTGGSVAGESGLFKVPTNGGPPVRIFDGEALSPVWSPKGDLIVYTGAQVQAVAPLLGITPDGKPVELPEIKVLREGRGERMRFLPDGRGLVYMEGLSPSMEFELLDLESMKIRVLTDLEDLAAMNTFDVSPDGSSIVFDRLRQNSDIVLVELAGAK